jgi:predicted DNA-binding transcriptional regulator AlpA
MSMEPLLNEFAVAKSLGLSVTTLRKWRGNGAGPKYLKIGGSVRYRAEDLQEYLDSRVVTFPEMSGKPSPIEEMVRVRVREENRLK